MFNMDDAARQLYLLDLAIETYPDAPVNTLMRGEYWIEQGQYPLAERDLQAALELAEEALVTSDWAYLYQSYVDRADELLRWIGQNSVSGTRESYAERD